MIKWILAVVCGVAAVVPVAYLAYKYTEVRAHIVQEDNTPVLDQKPSFEAVIDYISYDPTKPMQVGSEFLVKSCHVVDGFRYAMLLENDEWIETRLTVVTKGDATAKVIEILRASTTPPTVVLKRKIDDYWVVDVRLTVDQKDVMLSTLLKERNLVL